ncbi:CBS domain-containing protein [Methanobrevibacter filiformis]|uniref:Inosine-5'-monophosphate dehydrogenase n=1 Tax=Methanobrevibacter filiformis TaxID=55758 RepID=A0A166APG0_9EURY|nr:CBS domain-containing protein [Methanobrevibacter filiformis]KZX12301.1 inosine-5'-monophosphate dehydrogenase [Methanobrevibacter filiformis]
MQVRNIMSEDLIVIDKDQNVCDGLRLMKKNKISRLPVINTNKSNKKELVGIVTEKDIAIKLGSSKYGNLASSHFHMSTVMVKDILTAEEDMSVVEAANILIENNIGGMPIIDSGDIVGIVTKSDFIDTCRGKPYDKILVEEVMSTDLIAISAQDRLVHARRIILDSQIGRLLVTEKNELAGILTSKDITKALISFRKHVPDNHKQAQIKNIIVEEVMTSNVQELPTTATITESADAMLESGFNGFPVANDNGQIVGIITKSDLLSLIIELEMS